MTTGLGVTTFLPEAQSHMEPGGGGGGGIWSSLDTSRTAGPSSYSSLLLPNHHPLSRLFVGAQDTVCGSEMRDIKSLIGPNGF